MTEERSSTAVLNKTALEIAAYLPHRIYDDRNIPVAARDGKEIIHIWLGNLTAERRDETTLKALEYLVKGVERDRQEFPNAPTVLRLLLEKYHDQFKDNPDYAVMLSKLSEYK